MTDTELVTCIIDVGLVTIEVRLEPNKTIIKLSRGLLTISLYLVFPFSTKMSSYAGRESK